MTLCPPALNALRHSGVLEIGTYWGTSSLRVAHALPLGVPITTLELDPVHVAIARVLRLDIEFFGGLGQGD